MEILKQTNDTPYNYERMTAFVEKHGFFPGSEAQARKLTDEMIQNYLDSYSDDINGDAIDNVEALIKYLTSEGSQSEQAAPGETDAKIIPTELHEEDNFEFEAKPRGSEEALGKQATGVTTGGEWGVWGSLTERERRALLKKGNRRSLFKHGAKPDDMNTENTE